MKLIRCIPDPVSENRVFETYEAIGGLRIFARILVAISGLLIAGASPSSAQSAPRISELRLGIFDHNIEPGHSEGGVDVNVELLFEKSGRRYHNFFLDGFLRPNPHIGASINMGNDTSVGYAGLTWTLFRNDLVSLEASFGGAVHNGPLSRQGVASYGCSWGFRSSGSVGIALAPRWQLLITIDHMSNANLCDKNRGLTNAGVRLGYMLDG